MGKQGALSANIVIKKSGIHGRGVFAKRFIPKGTLVVEYKGEKITKKESECRAEEALQKAAKKKNVGAVYIFELNKRYDIDGDVPYNHAKYINHSCSPNCETVNIDGHIWIEAIRDIKKGEEITYNYGYSFDDLENEHACFCGSHNCVGFILKEEHWHKVINKRHIHAEIKPSRNR